MVVVLVKHHTKVYLSAIGADDTDWIRCEIPGCGKQAVDVHHVEARGMGGSKEKDNPDNLIGLCREHHIEFGDKKQFKSFLKSIINERNHK